MTEQRTKFIWASRLEICFLFNEKIEYCSIKVCGKSYKTDCVSVPSEEKCALELWFKKIFWAIPIPVIYPSTLYIFLSELIELGTPNPF